MQQHRINLDYENKFWDCSCGVYGYIARDESLVASKGSGKPRASRKRPIRAGRPARKWSEVKATNVDSPLADWERELLTKVKKK